MASYDYTIAIGFYEQLLNEGINEEIASSLADVHGAISRYCPVLNSE